MSSPYAMLGREDGAAVRLRPGDLIGRSHAAALHVNHPSISEVHAYLSLRGGELVLLALRGELTVDGVSAAEVRLEPGLRIDLAPGHAVAVAEVVVPDRVLAVAVDGGPSLPLVGEVMSLRADGSWVEGFDPGAVLRVWSTGDRWFCDDGGGPRPVGPLLRCRVAGRTVQFSMAVTTQVAFEPTHGRPRFPPLRIVSRWDTVQLQHAGAEPVCLSGLPARLLSELVAFGGSARWELVAGELWGASDPTALRARWDKVLASLRRKLVEGGIRSCLVQTSGGICQLVLLPADCVLVEEG